MTTGVNEGKRAAAYLAIDERVENGHIVGVGSGTTAVYAAERLGQRVKNEKLDIICIPTSFQARQLILKHNLVLGDLDRYPEIDVDFDGADEVDNDLNLIKGGGGCLTQEKVIASCSKQFIVIADNTKASSRLGERFQRGIPIEVLPLAYVPIMNRITKLFGGTIDLRIAKKKAGPVVTDNGNFLLDWQFDDIRDRNWADINVKISMMPGVVETGLFIGMACCAYFGDDNGLVTVRKSHKSGFMNGTSAGHS
jgi:ribose 5-phosphate isomerase A